MEGVKKKWKELLYSFSTNDRYADYNENQGTGISRGPGDSGAGTAAASSSQIQLTDFVDGHESSNDGVSETMLAWRHIEAWASENHSDLYATLSEPCTRSDIANAEKDLAIIFPASVRASLRLHDGQEDLESLTGTSGLIYGLQLMPLDQIVQMTMTWRSVADNMSKHNRDSAPSSPSNGSGVEVPNKSATPQTLKTKGYGKLDSQDYPTSNPGLQRDISQNTNKQFKMNSIPRQSSVPQDAIQPTYANAGWIPLVTDNAGNHVAVDLAPGPRGVYGQVILFGREFDTKYVVANNWGDFLLAFANDLEKGNWYIMDADDDYLSGEGDLVFRDKERDGPVVDYFDVLKARTHAVLQRQHGSLGQEQPEHAQSRKVSSGAPAGAGESSTMIEVSPVASGENATPDKKTVENTVIESPINSTQVSVASSKAQEDSQETEAEVKAEAQDILEATDKPQEDKSLEKEPSKDAKVAQEPIQTSKETESTDGIAQNSADEPAETSNAEVPPETASLKELKEEFESVAL
ncbi:LAQU0S03e00144g1_1 [Lachancea quebecensis]|uniref:LAQU0S03e00144g1_1 n=1 Tax=Lachancea quebecensis TaxID=1654605 RepID=A0A0P1KMS6_9SACH|nr:LAQU0S03e00144g1_1 [Lachancea quebecensis]